MTSAVLEKTEKTGFDYANSASCELYDAQLIIKLLSQALLNNDDGIRADFALNDKKYTDHLEQNINTALSLIYDKIENAINELDQPICVFEGKS